MRLRTILSCLIVISACFAAEQRDADLKSLYESRQWFKLRDAVRQRNAPAFYRGAVACAFNDLPQAERELHRVIASAPGSEEAYLAHNLLTYAYFRAGNYQRALAQLDQMLSMKPDNADDQASRALLSVLTRHPGRSVISRRASRLRAQIKGGSPFVPLSVNGRSADYTFDSGATLSVMAESEAKRLGLTIQDVDPKAQRIIDARGIDVGYRITVADRVAVGNTRLGNVVFLVLRDDQHPFAQMEAGQRGFLGLDVLLALETVRWSANGTFEIGFRTKSEDRRESNLCLDAGGLIAEAGFGRNRLNVVLDTGSETTNLWPRFANEFADLIKASGWKDSRRIIGVGGSKDVEAMTLPEVLLRVGGFNATLGPAHVLLQPTTPDNHWYYARLGRDLLSQARRVTLDFKVMSLTLE
jgi:predicted aspartyl protease